MQNTISEIKHFECGTCTNNLKTMFKGKKSQTVVFPVSVFLFKHEKHGYCLYDTGNGVDLRFARYFLYRLVTGSKITEAQTISKQLATYGVSPEDIKYLFLSHLHPDHIGDLKSFPNAKIVVTAETESLLNKSKPRDLVFRKFIPENIMNQLKVVRDFKDDSRFPHIETNDFFGDGSVLICSLGGHASGQLCVFFDEHKLMIAADCLWDTDYIEYINEMRFIPRLIQNNWKDYLHSADIVGKIRNDDISVVVCHDEVEKVREILCQLQ